MYKGYLLGACRTPIGNYGGAFKDKKPAELGILVVQDALRRAGIRPEQVDEVVFGCVLTGGHGQNIARQVSVGAGIPIEKPAATISKVCGSGLAAVVAASRMVQLGDADCVVAGGVEIMSQAPYVLPTNRWGARMGDTQIVDSMIRDGLWDYFNDYHMGITAENVAEQWNISREEQDAFACASQQKAAAAQESGAFDDEIVPVEVKVKREVKVVDKDEFVRPGTTMEALAKLRPAFKKDGTVTAGNASGINDGAACVIVVSEKFLKEYNLKPMAGIVSYHSAGVKPEIMGVGPIPSVRGALEKAGLSVNDIDLFELNEAFASQSIAVCRDLEVPAEKVNTRGGAIALGHPIGASGARILVTLLHAMQHDNAKRGVASLCIGGGMGEAMIVEREAEV